VRVWLENAAYVAAGVVAFVLFWVAARTLRDLVGRWLVRHHVEADAVVLGRRAVYVTLLLVGALVALSFAFQSGNVTIAGVVVATVVASLGVQDVLKNYVSGYYVLLERHLHVGDAVEFDRVSGVIEDIRLRVTLLRAPDGSLVVVPNTQLFNSVVAVKRSAGRPRRGARSLGKRSQDHAAESLESA